MNCNINYIQIAILFLMCSSFVYAQQSNIEVFKKGNTFYKEGKYKEAIEEYKNIKNTENADLYFNMANSYYKLNEVASAIYYYEKALKTNPSHSGAKSNLVFAKRMTIDAIDPLPKTFLQRLSKQTIQQLNYNTWAMASAISSLLFVLLFLMYFFSKTSRKKIWWFNLSIFAISCTVLSVLFAYHTYNIEKQKRSAIIFSPSVEIKNAPTQTGDAVFELHEGTKVQLLDELDGWKKIKIANGKEGWINEESLREI